MTSIIGLKRSLEDLRAQIKRRFRDATALELTGQVRDSVSSSEELEDAIDVVRGEMDTAKT